VVSYYNQGFVTGAINTVDSGWAAVTAGNHNKIRDTNLSFVNGKNNILGHVNNSII
jgi:hypothetical protein